MTRITYEAALAGDERGDLVAFGRMEGAPVRSVTISINKPTAAQDLELARHALAQLKARSGAERHRLPRLSRAERADTITFQPTAWDDEAALGLHMSDTVVVTRDGCRRLSARPLELRVV
jgi:hypothetical protein